MDELGIPGIEIESWYGVCAPANMPKEVVNVLNPEIDEAMKAPRVDDRLISQGPIPVGSNAADFAAFMKSEN
jgi:tripartite-type tricarboxylate transporter receptor subunit TctC